ncbi:5-methyltetrahydropteroyltriglutamate--homocysteine S-methyltransferase [Paenibacillus methanolicus]|uniref:5-methyltetrahydropteroyltriglutamate--homocysteine methyltransferase n=1 Tax=Paenibacillus methanolicus TaxID=582686 RepID=A0A5S5CHN6_9BACL|nr:5-methyltetrahydropteroyltriglutamate--homocysteine S-methyltransferase [Paenibacillus methanolicus]TYP79044.1 5-methyltetrahydropteroyltriglutamate--homocysteine methyltransferase [Paenibacillus methanolicus]
MARSSILGYPRIGEKREWKQALEAYWSGKLDEEAFRGRMKEIRLDRLRKLQASGIDLIPVGDFSEYDHVLDTAAMFGIVPKRFAYHGGEVHPSIYFGIARGTKEAAASEMTKWFNTNYHYIVPELDGTAPTLTENRPLRAYLEAKETLGIEGKPVLLGPLTFLRMSKGYDQADTDAWLDRLLPLYEQVLRELEQAGAQWVQIDEPALVQASDIGSSERLSRIYGRFAEAAPRLNIMLQTYFESVDDYEAIIELPVQGIGLDFAHGRDANLSALRKHGFPSDKVLGAGIVDGRGIWKASLANGCKLLEDIARFVPSDRLIVQSSCSLLHVPVTVQGEDQLPQTLRHALSFADEKLEEIALLARAAELGAGAIAAETQASEAALQALNAHETRNRKDVQAAVSEIAVHEGRRDKPFAERQPLQQAKWQLPLLPTTTIGSFPQTADVRKARQQWRKGEWSKERYDGFIREQIDKWVGLQEEIGLDVLVHGEFERTDMVEFFGEKLAGFAFTRGGWVQSYGSRCVKPPIIYGDVAFEGAMTVEETAYAQSKTSRPVKGMLTGPVTIMNWSFVREDIAREQIAYQLAFALRQEVEALETAGIGLIQVDEPAVREGLPLKREAQAEYLAWAVKAFRLTTCTVCDTTQIHTHMCYCEFHDMLGSIEAMDADVISIETSRSHGELIHHFETQSYPLGIGLGVYDIHSPRVPRTGEMTAMIGRALQALDPALFWINPDCGLKTRGEEETVAALRNMVEAARAARRSVAATV